MIDNKIDYEVALEVASHEAIVRSAYKDVKNIWTWSIGLTNASGHNVERYIDKPQTLKHCLAVYVWALEKYAKDVREAFTKPLTQKQFAAALSFHYNTGAIKRATWVKSFNAGDIEKARKEIMNYSKPASIIARRTKERDLFFDGKWSNNGNILEYQVSATHKPVNPKSINIEQELKAAFVQNQPVILQPVEIKPISPTTSNPTGKLIALVVAVGSTVLATIGKALGLF